MDSWSKWHDEDHGKNSKCVDVDKCRIIRESKQAIKRAGGEKPRRCIEQEIWR